MNDIESKFERDNFSSRRTSGHNLFDPESLLTGDEIARGLGYGDKRVWPNQETYERACAGLIPASDIPAIAPRVRVTE